MEKLESILDSIAMQPTGEQRVNLPEYPAIGVQSRSEVYKTSFSNMYQVETRVGSRYAIPVGLPVRAATDFHEEAKQQCAKRIHGFLYGDILQELYKARALAGYIGDSEMIKHLEKTIKLIQDKL